jgi:biotin transport system substrate-specific component
MLLPFDPMSKPRVTAVAAPRTASLDRGIALGAVLFATVLTTLAAQISVTLPGSVIPYTMQPAAVLLAGAVLGARLGAASQLLYLAAGAVGTAMFAWSPVLLPGLARLAGPTGGYLLAFPIAAFVTGRLADRGWTERVAGAFAAMLAGLVVLHVVGGAWTLAMTPAARGWTGVAVLAPFAVVDVLKIAAAAAVAPGCRRLLGR